MKKSEHSQPSQVIKLKVRKTKEAIKQAKALNLESKLEKQIALLINNTRHPSLDNKIIQPKWLKRWSFRIDGKHRARYVFNSLNEIEIYRVGDFH